MLGCNVTVYSVALAQATAWLHGTWVYVSGAPNMVGVQRVHVLIWCTCKSDTAALAYNQTTCARLLPLDVAASAAMGRSSGEPINRKLPLTHPASVACRMYRLALAALLQQRVAGMVYCYSAWNKWHEKTCTQLREEMDRLVKAKTSAQEKAGKAAKETAQQDQERKQKVDQVGTTANCRASLHVSCHIHHCQLLLQLPLPGGLMSTTAGDCCMPNCQVLLPPTIVACVSSNCSACYKAPAFSGAVMTSILDPRSADARRPQQPCSMQCP